jgi:hypothetical protein
MIFLTPSLRCDGYWTPAARFPVPRRSVQRCFSFAISVFGKARCNHGLKVEKNYRGFLLVKKISTVHLLKRNATKNYYLGGLRFNDAFRKSPVNFRSELCSTSTGFRGKSTAETDIALVYRFYPHSLIACEETLLQINVQ